MSAVNKTTADSSPGAETPGERAGSHIEVRLARDAAEIAAAQALRYRVFYEEMAAKPTPEMAATRRDIDRFDTHCDHLVVIDQRMGDGPEAVVGTYRLLRRSVADKHGGFYSETEFDISPLKSMPGELLELGRSCVDARYRTRSTMQRLWSGIAAYVFAHDVRVMFGCASLPGTDPRAVAGALSYLHHRHLAPARLRPRALPGRYVDMNLLAPDSVSEADAAKALDERAVLAGLPPLIKGYLRLGGFIGDGAVIDEQFNTIDVCIIVVTDQLTDKYFNHYQRKLGED